MRDTINKDMMNIMTGSRIGLASATRAPRRAGMSVDCIASKRLSSGLTMANDATVPAAAGDGSPVNPDSCSSPCSTL